MNLRLDLPVSYKGDALYTLSIIKGVADGGSFLENPRLGLPGDGADLHAYPTADIGHHAVLRILLALGASPVAAYNLFYVLSFALCAASATWVLGRWSLPAPLAAAGGVLFSVTPFHFMRGAMQMCSHLYLAAYFMVPLAVWALCRVLECTEEDGHDPLRDMPGVVGVCVFLPAFGIYYTAFFLFLLTALAILTAIVRGETRALRLPLQLAGITTACLALHMAPELVRLATDPAARTVVTREPGEIELFGLKMAQMLLPFAEHPLPWFSRIGLSYHTTAPLRTENESAVFGTLGSICYVTTLLTTLAFLCKPAWLMDRAEGRRLHWLGVIGLLAFLFGTVGGLATVFSYVFSTTLIRSVNRMSVYILFVSIAVVLLLVQGRWEKLTPGAQWGVLAGALTFLLWDSNVPYYRPDYNVIASAYASDAQFMAALDNQLPAGTRVFQLPYVAFPESQWEYEEYEQLRPYLHSRNLRFSFGAVKNTQADMWNRVATGLLNNPPDFLKALHTSFDGVLVHRDFARRHLPLVLEAAEEVLGAPLLVSENGDFAYYRMP